MKIPCPQNPYRGQTSMEYILLLTVVAVVVIASFKQGFLVSQVHNSAEGYYNSVTRIIMGENATPINGGWCPVTCPPSGSFGPKIIYATCACPQPAFGGAFCSGAGASVDCSAQGVIPCAYCPAGQTCVSDGAGGSKCACPGPTPLTCNGQGGSPIGSIPGLGCTACICPYGTTYDSTNNACDKKCSNPCTSWNGASCVAIVCPANSTCSPTAPSTQLCQCWSGYTWNGTSCAANCSNPCSSWNGTSCVAISCPANSTCNPSAPLSQLCQCWTGYYWNGSGCVWGTGTCTPTTACSATLNCSSDSCGTSCGTCSLPQTCNSTVAGTPGSCHCTPDCSCAASLCSSSTCLDPICGTTCNGIKTVGTCCTPNCSCAANTCPGSTCYDPTCGTLCSGTKPSACTATLNCSSDSCGNVCGTCAAPQSCSSSVAGTPGKCLCPNTCASSNCGTDPCGHACGTCASPQYCSSSVTGTPGTCKTDCVGSWGTCSNGAQTYTVTTPAANGGASCPYAGGTTQVCCTPSSKSFIVAASIANRTNNKSFKYCFAACGDISSVSESGLCNTPSATCTIDVK